MGNKLFKASKEKPGKASKGRTLAASFLAQEEEGSAFDESALRSELKAAQERALELTAGVDLLADELRLEQQLAALDDEAIDEEGAAQQSRAAGDDEELDLDALDHQELEDLENELQELEREVLGVANWSDSDGANAVADTDGGEGAVGGEEAAEVGTGVKRREFVTKGAPSPDSAGGAAGSITTSQPPGAVNLALAVAASGNLEHLTAAAAMETSLAQQLDPGQSDPDPDAELKRSKSQEVVVMEVVVDPRLEEERLAAEYDDEPLQVAHFG